MQGLDALTPAQRRPTPRVAWLIPAASALLLLLFLGGSSLLYYRSLGSARTIPGLLLGSTRLGSLSPAELDRIIGEEAVRYGEEAVTVVLGASTRRVSRQELGAVVDVAATRQRALLAGKTGSFLRDLVDRVQARRSRLRLPLVATLDRDQALDFFAGLKEVVDRPPVPARLDLDRGIVVPGKEGLLLRVYDCLAATELALGRGEDTVQAALTVRPPGGKGSRLQGMDISHVLGQFATVYSLADKDADRAFNLKVGASKLDGATIAPGGRLSFNERVGQRTEAQGYRMAPVITEGELVDGMAGGACQLSSTLFSAAFFAGLDLESSRPHTRPSSYIKMGLDAAVAYPGTDLVLKNPYPFPVVVHFKVNQGKVQVRILGKQRPWRKVVFEREIKETIPFATEVRKVNTIPQGRRVVAQNGVPGFKLERRRLFFGKGRDPERVERREIRYPSTTQFIHEGTGPAQADWSPPPEHSPFGDVKPIYTLEQ